MNTEQKPTLEQVATLDGAELDYWTGIAAGLNVEMQDGKACTLALGNVFVRTYQPTETWSDGGPLIERFKIDLEYDSDDNFYCAGIGDAKPWEYPPGQQPYAYGHTPQMAICRAVVAAWISKSTA